MSSESARLKLRVKIRAYVGALHVAATLLALVILAGAFASTASAQPSSPQASRVLLPGAGFQPGGSRSVRELQRLLTRVGYFLSGAVDGRYGLSTERAVWRFQADRGLEADGIAGPQTWSALDQAGRVLMPGAGFQTAGSAPVRGLQRMLARAGYSPGPIDGRYGPLTEDAVKRFQEGQGLRVDGIAGPHTFARLRPTARVRAASRVHAGPGVMPRVPASTASPRISRRVVPRAGRRAAPAASPRLVPAASPRLVPAASSTLARRSGPSGLSTGWIVLLCALAVAALAAVALYARLRRGGGAPRPSKVRRVIPSGWHAAVVAEVRRRAGAVKPGRAAQHAIGRLSASPGKAELAARASVSKVRRVLASAGRRTTVAAEAPSAASAAEAEPVVPVAEFQPTPPAAKVQPSRSPSKRRRGKTKEAPVEPSLKRGRAVAHNGNGASAHNSAAQPLVFPATSSGNGHRDDPRGEAERAFHVGVLLEEQNDLAGAEAAYRRADEGGHAAAASNLGVLLEGQGDMVGAEAAYRRAANRGDANGAFNLGVLLEEQRDLVRAQDAYRRADERGHAAAASNLGVLLEGQGDVVGAEAAYRRAAERGEANGAFNLGVLLEERGDVGGAESAYRLADQTGEAKVAQMARAALLDLASAAGPVGAGRTGGSDGA